MGNPWEGVPSAEGDPDEIVPILALAIAVSGIRPGAMKWKKREAESKSLGPGDTAMLLKVELAGPNFLAVT